MAIRVCILAERCFRPSHMQMKNCDPDQTSTGSWNSPQEGPGSSPTRGAAHGHPLAKARDEIGITQQHHRHQIRLPQENQNFRMSRPFACRACSSGSAGSEWAGGCDLSPSSTT